MSYRVCTIAIIYFGLISTSFGVFDRNRVVVNAFDKLTLVDRLLDTLDTVQPYTELAKIIGDRPTTQKIERDGCSGGISWAWENLVFPILIQNKLAGSGTADEMRFPLDACCVRHDSHYFKAFYQAATDSTVETMKLTSNMSSIHRKEADTEFLQCLSKPENKQKLLDSLLLAFIPDGLPKSVARLKEESFRELTSRNIISHLMYFGVRFGGRPCSNHSYRWGNGYESCQRGESSTAETSFYVLVDLITRVYSL